MENNKFLPTPLFNKDEYLGNLWVEVMLVRGLNDSTQALEGIAKVLQKIRPDAVHINLPTRPPVETWVQPTDEARIEVANEPRKDL